MEPSYLILESGYMKKEFMLEETSATQFWKNWKALSNFAAGKIAKILGCHSFDVFHESRKLISKDSVSFGFEGNEIKGSELPENGAIRDGYRFASIKYVASKDVVCGPQISDEYCLHFLIRMGTVPRILQSFFNLKATDEHRFRIPRRMLTMQPATRKSTGTKMSGTPGAKFRTKGFDLALKYNVSLKFIMFSQF